MMLNGLGMRTGIPAQGYYRINEKSGIESSASEVEKNLEKGPAVNSGTDPTANPTADPVKERQEQSVIRELINIEKKVIAHEQAHMAAGSGVTGAAGFTYTNGPDGKRYISGGEVAINVPATDDPKKGVALMQRVIEAALAPADPSPQDIKVAQSAQARLIALNQQILLEKGKVGLSKGENQKSKAVDSEAGIDIMA